MKDNEIVSLIKQNSNQRALKMLYKSYPKIKKYLLKLGVEKLDVEDIFQEALYIFIKQVNQNSSFELNSNLEAYLTGICRNISLKKFRDIKEFTSDIEIPEKEIEVPIDRNINVKKIERVLEKVGEKCLKLLKKFYYENLSTKEIAEELNYSSANSVKTQKYKCLQSAKSIALKNI